MGAKRPNSLALVYFHDYLTEKVREIDNYFFKGPGNMLKMMSRLLFINLQPIIKQRIFK